jgi:hypothetical protein
MKLNRQFCFMALLASSPLVLAGDLTSPAAPTVSGGGAMYTLEDIYNRLDTGATASLRSGTFAGPSAGPGSTGHTLTGVYNKANTVINQARVPSTGLTDSVQDGDDGDLQKGVPWPNPRFTNNNDGTITDNLTGLIWPTYSENASGGCDYVNTLDWSEIFSTVASLEDGLCDLTDGSSPGDWRIPNIRELHSLVDYRYTYPALSNMEGTAKIDDNHPFSDIRFGHVSTTVWSSTAALSLASAPTLIYVLTPWDGSIQTHGTVGSQSSEPSIILPVRGGRDSIHSLIFPDEITTGLDSPASPDASGGGAMKTLDDIYNRLDTGMFDLIGSPRAGAFAEPSANPSSTGHTLTEVYNKANLVMSQAYIPRTGTTRTFEDGDDGDIRKGVRIPNPRFKKNNDGTVTDRFTALVWLRDANCFALQDWETALSLTNNLADGSCDLSDDSSAGDWRLPNIRELNSLVNYLYEAPPLSDTFGFNQWSEGNPFYNVQHGYWSSTPFNAPSQIWYQGFARPNSAYPSVGYLPAHTDFYVWPVRGGQ